jgi:hypothetical protein
MTTIENQRALDPIIDGLVKRLRAIECTQDDLQYTVERILNEAARGDEDRRLDDGGAVMARVMGSFTARLTRKEMTAKNFQVQAENAAKMKIPGGWVCGSMPEDRDTEHMFSTSGLDPNQLCCGSQDTIREIGDAIRKEVTDGNIKLPDTDVTNALTDEQIAQVKAMRDVSLVKPDPGTGKARGADSEGRNEAQ